jgi:hypothetical protein
MSKADLNALLGSSGYELLVYDEGYGIMLSDWGRIVYENTDLSEIEDWIDCNL